MARPSKPSAGRAPPTLCWPTHATICAMLMGEPLAPHVAMASAALLRCRVRMQALPAASRTLFRVPCTLCCTRAAQQ